MINQAIPAIGAVVIKDNKILLVKRCNPPNKNKWAIPGGKIRLGESLNTAAEREVFEETGLCVKSLYPIHAFDYIETYNNKIQFHYVIVDTLCDFVSGVLYPADDVSDAQWFDPENIIKIDIDSESKRLIRRIQSNELLMGKL